MIRTLIIDDEMLARQGLILLLRKLAGVELVGEAADGDEGIELIEKLRPDLILLDINMPGMNGMEMLHKLRHRPAVIFTTAYSGYAVQAFREDAVDYLLKPVSEADLRTAISRVMARLEPDQGLQNLLQHLRPEPAYRSRFLFKKGIKLIPVQAEEIAYIFSRDKEIAVTLRDGRQLQGDESLDKLESQLDPRQFFRANRQTIVQQTAIREVDFWFKGKLKLLLQPDCPDPVIVSAEKSAAFRQWLDQ